MFLTRHPGLLQRTFGVGTPYMPQAAGGGAIDPYVRSMQWSRRFIGLKLFLSLAAAGWEGYVEVLRHQLAMADRLRRGLERRGWEVVNDTPLPLVCFADRGGADPAAIVARVVRSGRAWISIARIGDGRPVIRACITNYRTTAEHVDELIEAAGDARDA
jgi:glutamate/tyrosine decarboxylase-like PLP-dependent enzyme